MWGVMEPSKLSHGFWYSALNAPWSRDWTYVRRICPDGLEGKMLPGKFE